MHRAIDGLILSGEHRFDLIVGLVYAPRRRASSSDLPESRMAVSAKLCFSVSVVRAHERSPGDGRCRLPLASSRTAVKAICTRREGLIAICIEKPLSLPKATVRPGVQVDAAKQ